MAVRIKIRCLQCLTVLAAPSFDDFPESCPKCWAPLNDKERPEVAAPFIPLRGGAHSKAIDQVYRDAERSSEARIEQAVAMTPGSSKEDFSHLKITNYRSGMVEGESAVKPPQPSVEFTNHVAALKGAGVSIAANGGMALTGQAQAYSAQTRTGPEPNAGLRALNRVRSHHALTIDPRISGGVSSIPALETQQPGYTSRG